MIGPASVKPSNVELAFGLFQRAVGVYCILLGIAYWVRLIGVYEGELWRYDLMPLQWRVAAVSLALLFPIAGAGLWMVASWGPVIWLLCAAGEILMYGFFHDTFGWQPSAVIFHASAALVYVGFRTVIYLQKRAET